jgi:hypothetical protein
MSRNWIFALLGTAFIGANALAADEYPRLGAYAISSPHDYYTTAYKQDLAKVQVSVINYYPGWGTSQNASLDSIARDVKSRNPKTRVFAYTLGESLQIPGNTVWLPYRSAVDTEKWWLYSAGTAGSRVLSDYGKEYYVLNISSQGRKNSSGQNFASWFSNYVYNTYARTNPSLDGIFTDNVFWKPRRDGDWNGDGKIDSQNNATVQSWYRAGYRQYLNSLKAKMPGKLQMANVADWGLTQSVTTEYNQQWNGGVLENVIGASYSLEGRTGGWPAMMAQYRKTMAALAPPKLLIFQQRGSPTDYQAMRYGLGACLMDDGYYYFTDASKGNYRVPWFDEFDAKLGPATSPPQASAWKSGVYRRDFQNGIALVNPRGNGPRTVTLDGEFVKLKGSQAPSVNDGATVRQVTLKDRDGIILMRKSPTRRPAAPGGVSIEQ